MFRLFLVRHGETDWNVAKRYLGQTDLSLNFTGRKQVEHLAQKLREVNFLRCYTSDLIRARQTASTILQEHSTDLIIEPALREASFGNWEGLTYAEVCNKYPLEVTSWVDSEGLIAPGGGESLEDLKERLAIWLEDLYAEDPEGNILVVTHGGPLRVLLCLLMGFPITKYWKFCVEPSSMAILEVYDGEAILQIR
jgi:alpha-ribazole phosphatase